MVAASEIANQFDFEIYTTCSLEAEVLAVALKAGGRKLETVLPTKSPHSFSTELIIELYEFLPAPDWSHRVGGIGRVSHG